MACRETFPEWESVAGRRYRPRRLRPATASARLPIAITFFSRGGDAPPSRTDYCWARFRAFSTDRSPNQWVFSRFTSVLIECSFNLLKPTGVIWGLVYFCTTITKLHLFLDTCTFFCGSVTGRLLLSRYHPLHIT